MMKPQKKNSAPKISVLMMAYNAQETIGEAIESVLTQSFSDFELVIADDCSTDNTLEIIRNYSKKDSRIIIIRNKKNEKVAGNRNVLIRHAKAKYIAWQDADDIAYPYRLEHQYAYIVNHSDICMVGGYLQFFNENGNTTMRKYAKYDKDIRKNIFKYSPVAHPGAMMAKKCFDIVGNYDIKCVAEDLDMAFRLGTKYKFANLQEAVIRYRDNSNSVTYKKLREMERSSIAIRKKYAYGYGYKMSFSDIIYNKLQEITIDIIPTELKIKIFNLFRNNR